VSFIALRAARRGVAGHPRGVTGWPSFCCSLAEPGFHGLRTAHPSHRGTSPSQNRTIDRACQELVPVHVAFCFRPLPAHVLQRFRRREQKGPARRDHHYGKRQLAGASSQSSRWRHRKNGRIVSSSDGEARGRRSSRHRPGSPATWPCSRHAGGRLGRARTLRLRRGTFFTVNEG